MGEFEKSNGHSKGLLFALEDILTYRNFGIAVFSGLVGYVVVEFLRKRI
jgi:hypothetical protein